MKLMQQTKRFLAILLAVTMTLGTAAMPASAEVGGTEEPLAEIVSFSDFQRWIGADTDFDTLKVQLSDRLTCISDAGVTPDYLFFGGDYSCQASKEASDTGRGYVNEIIQATWPEFSMDNMITVQGNHDPADTEGLTATGPVEYDDFLVYCIREDDFPWTQGDSAAKTLIQSTVADLTTWLQGRIDAKETRPIFLTTHVGLHYDIDRGDGNNQYAYLLFDALNEAGKYLDIIYMFGHNHTTGDELVGGSLTCYPKGDTLGVCTEKSIAKKSGTSAVLNFNYMNYGYVGYIGDINNHPDLVPTGTDVLTASVLTLYEDRVEVDRYSDEGLIEERSVTLERDYYTGETDFGPTYTLTYDSQGGTEVASMSSTASWSTISRIVPEIEGMVFTGWYTNADGTGDCYQTGESIYLAEDQTLYAQYEVKIPTERYVRTYTMEPGKEYLLIWNMNYYDNKGDKYALTEDDGNHTTLMDAEWVSEDHMQIDLPMAENYDTMCWEVAAEEDGYIMKNSNTGHYLVYDGSTLGFADEPTVWALHEDVRVTSDGTPDKLVDKLTPYDNEGVWLRFGTTAKIMQMTDWQPRNSKPYLYVKDDNSHNGIKIADFDFDTDVTTDMTAFEDTETGAKANFGTGATVETTTRDADNGNALVFNGTNTYLELVNADGTGLLENKNWEEITVSYDSCTEGGTWSLFAKNDAYDGVNGNERYYLGIIDTGSKVKVETKGDYGIEGSTIQSEWKHVDVVFKENKTELYIDRELVKDTTTSWTLQDILGTDNTVWLGKASWGSGEFYKGQIDNLEIYAVEASETTDGTLIADFTFDTDVTDGMTEFTDATGTKAVFGEGAAVATAARDEANGRALVFDGSTTYLELTKADGTGLLSGRDVQEVVVTYESYTEDSGHAQWSFFADQLNAPLEEGAAADRHYLGILDRVSSVDVETMGANGIGYGTSAEWKQVKVVFRDYQTKLFINGKQEKSIETDWTLNRILGEESTLWIGKSHWGSGDTAGEHYQGQIDNLQIYVKETTTTPDPTPTPTPDPTPTPTPVELPFEDVTEADPNYSWFGEGIKSVYEKGIMGGYTDTRFAPYENITRADFALTLYRIAEKPAVTYDDKFPDVAEGAYYADAVIWAGEKGIVTGYADGKFHPNDKISRQDMVVMLYRYVKKPVDEATGDYSSFTDADDVYAYASDAIKWAMAKGLLKGNADGTLLPQKNISRAEIAVILDRFIG